MINLKMFVVSLLLMGGVSFGLAKWLSPPKVVYNTEYEQRVIDSLTVAKRATVLERDALMDSLTLVHSALADEIERSGQLVANYTRVIGALNVEIDSLQGREYFDLVAEDISSSAPSTGSGTGSEVETGSKFALRATISDTFFVRQATFGDNLLRSTAIAGFEGGLFFMDPPEINLLRDVRIDVVTTLNKDATGVTTFVTSPDFRDLRVESYTMLKAKRKRLPWFWIGAAVGVVGWELARGE